MKKDQAAWREETAAKVHNLYSAELTGHFEVEEEVLFPQMERYLGSLPLVAELRGDHEALRGLVTRVGQGLGPPREGHTGHEREVGPLRDPDALDEFSALIERHVRKEERQLFVEFEKRMPADEAVKVGSEIEARLIKACPKL